MDVNSITTLVSSVGFPIVACIYMALSNEKLQKTLNELTNTLTLMNERIKDVETAVKAQNEMEEK